MRQDIIKLYDEYTHERLDRRVFMDQLAKLAGGTTAAAALVPILKANYASAAIVPEGDARLTVEEVSFPGAGGDVQGYLARPADAVGPAAGRGGDPREPRPQPAYRGRRAARGARGLRRIGARFPLACGRHARRTRTRRAR